MYGYDKSISNIKGRAIDIIHTVSGTDLNFEKKYASKIVFDINAVNMTRVNSVVKNRHNFFNQVFFSIRLEFIQ